MFHRIRPYVTSALCAATLITAAPAFAEGVPVDAASEAQVSSATEAYLAGKASFDAGSFDAALAKFRESYDIVASPNARLMVIATLAELGRVAEAYAEIDPATTQAQEAAMREEKYQATVTSLEALRGELQGKVGMVSVAVPPGAEGSTLVVGGRTIPPEAWSRPIAVDPGPVTIELTGFPPQEATIAAGGSTAVSFDAPTIEDPGEGDAHADGHVFTENRRIIAYSAAGVGGVGMILFGVFGGLTLSAEGSLQDACDPTGRCPATSQDDIDSGKTYQTVANVGLVVGIVGLAAGAGLFVWDILDEEPAGSDDGDDLALRLHASPSYLGLEGTF